MITHFSFSEIRNILFRRKLFLIFPFLSIVAISVAGAFLLPKKYESYITILLEKDEILNPLVGIPMAVSMTQGDRLTSFNEIIFSRSTIVTLLDSLGKLSKVRDEEALSNLVVATRRTISTTQRGSDSFRVTVTDSDPIYCQQAATLVARIYIDISLKSKQQQNEAAVNFFEEKVREYQKTFELQQQDLLSTKQQRLSSLPQGETAFNQQLDYVEAELVEAKKVLAQQQSIQSQLQLFTQKIDDQATVSQISSLESHGAVLYVSELKNLSVKYNDLLSKYTPRFPEVQMVRNQLVSLLRKSSDAISSDIDLTKAQIGRIETRRRTILSNLNRSYSLAEKSHDRSSSYEMAKEFYEEMKTKLEQAKVSRDLGLRAANKYVILDPAQIPANPTKPNKQLIVMGGFALGILVGIAAAAMAEYLDPTIRRPRDIQVFKKPVIAYLP